MVTYKVSLCTVSMNRLHHLKKTLPLNILDNAGFVELEFVIVDYNSSDGLEGYVKENFPMLIADGRLKLFRTSDPAFFNRTHARNMAFRLASGDIVCNVDADNFTGPGFASYIYDIFSSSSELYLTTIGGVNSVSKDILGRICVRKKDFLAVSGYDETMNSYGFEDFDFSNRLELLGLKRRTIINPEFLYSLPHGTEERIVNEYLINSTHAIYLKHQTPFITEILLLFKDQHFETIFLTDAVENSEGEGMLMHNLHISNRYSTDDKKYKKGKWRRGEMGIQLSNSQDMPATGNEIIQDTTLNFNNYAYLSTDFKLVERDEFKAMIVLLIGEISNRKRMVENLNFSRIKVNSDHFGLATYRRIYN
jgi:GT2 family glycosyltransferase